MSLRYANLHSWDLEPTAARALQSKLSAMVNTHDDLPQVHLVGGIDIGFEDRGLITRAAAVVLSFPGLELLEQSVARVPTHFPYIPGLLSFREVPAALIALEQLELVPDLILCDGQGYAHPRRFGLACHMGLLTGIPSIGAAKSRLIGESSTLAHEKGCWVPLRDGLEVIGAVVRTRSGVAPMYVSVGHRVGLVSAIAYVLACCPRYRVPETTRFAHRIASRR